MGAMFELSGSIRIEMYVQLPGVTLNFFRRNSEKYIVKDHRTSTT